MAPRVSTGDPGADALLAAGWSLWAGGRDTAMRLAGVAFTDEGRPLVTVSPAFHAHAVRAGTGMFLHEHDDGFVPHAHVPPLPGSGQAAGSGAAVPLLDGPLTGEQV